MSNVRVHSILAAISCLLALASSLHAQEHRWGIEASLAKNQYVQHEPIWLDITLTNVTSDTQRTDGLEYPNHRQFLVDVKDSAGHSLKYTGGMFDFASAPGALLLEPGQTDYGSFGLAGQFGITGKGSDGMLMGFWFPLMNCGSYTVQVHFEDAASAELSFLVVKPSGEAKKMLHLIKKANSDWKKHKLPAASLKFREAVDRFPDGPYADKCYYLSTMYSPEVQGNRSTYDKTILDSALLSKYPNSGDSRDWILAITRKMDSQAEKKFLDKLAEANPNSRSAKFVKLAQVRINSWKAGK